MPAAGPCRTCRGFIASNRFLAALALVVFLAVAGIPPFSGFWPKVMLVKAALDIGSWWLVGALLVTGFLSLMAVARVFAFAFWRDHAQSGAKKPAGSDVKAVVLPASALAPVVLLITLITLIGLFPEPLLALSQQAATDLINATAYVDAVFPERVAP